MSETIGEAFVAIRPDTRGFANETKSSVGTVIKGLAGAFAAVKVADFFGDAVGEAHESQKVGAQTEAVIKSTGKAAHVTAGQVDELSSSLSEKAGVDDEVIAAGANMLLTFTNVRNEVGKGNNIFDQATGIALDMAVAMKASTGGVVDLKGSSIQLGKALNDPIAGITALTRSGVTFTQQQKDQIKALVESGDRLGAQKIILHELNKEFGGSAAAQATGADKMNVAWGNFKETIGNLLLPVIDKLLKLATPILKFLSDNEGAAKALAAVVGGALVLAFEAWTASMISAAAAAFGLEVATGPIFLVVAAITAVIAAAVLLWTNWDRVWTWIKEHPAIAIVISILAAPVAAFVLIIGALKTLYENWDSIWGTIKSILQAAWDNVLKPIFDAIAGALGGIVWAVGIIKGIWDGIFDGLKSAWENVGAPVVNTIIGLVGTAVDLFNTLNDLFLGGRGAYSGGPSGDGSPFGAGKTIEGATGGWPTSRGFVPGFGSGDTIPALLTPGEYVMSRAEVAAARRGGGGQPIYVTVQTSTPITQRTQFAVELHERLAIAAELAALG